MKLKIRYFTAWSLWLLTLYVVLTVLNNIIPCGQISNPVLTATRNSWSPLSFWYFPWGVSGVHKGIDIFAARNAKVLSPVNGILLETGYGKISGNFVYILDCRLQLYYFAHLEKHNPDLKFLVSRQDLLGYVGDSGNAEFSACHLHFSIMSLTPISRNFQFSCHEKWKRLFYVDPNLVLP